MMDLAVGAALAACLAFAAAGPYLARVLPPPAAVRLLLVLATHRARLAEIPRRHRPAARRQSRRNLCRPRPMWGPHSAEALTYR